MTSPIFLRRIFQWYELRLRSQLGMRKAKMVFQSKVHDQLWMNCHAQMVMRGSWTFSYLDLKWAWDPHRDSSFNFDLCGLFQSKTLSTDVYFQNWIRCLWIWPTDIPKNVIDVCGNEVGYEKGPLKLFNNFKNKKKLIRKIPKTEQLKSSFIFGKNEFFYSQILQKF